MPEMPLHSSENTANVERKNKRIAYSTALGLTLLIVIATIVTILMLQFGVNQSTTNSSTTLTISKDNSSNQSETILLTTATSIATHFSNGKNYHSIARYSDSESLSPVVVDDLDGDEKPDIIVGLPLEKQIHVFFDNEKMQFQTKIAINCSDHLPHLISAADLDNDKRIDILSVDEDKEELVIYHNNGQRDFIQQTTYSTGLSPHFLTTADVNNDGYVDIIIGYASDDRLGIHLNQKDGSFLTESIFYRSACEGYHISLADFNNDDYIDLVLLSPFEQEPRVNVLLNDGQGSFTVHFSFTTEEAPFSGGVTDFNDDGKLDLVLLFSIASQYVVYLNDGENKFQEESTYAVAEGAQSLTVSDVNGDKRADIIVVNIDSASVTVYANNGTGKFSDAQNYRTDAMPRSVVLKDMNNDNDLDIVVGHQTSIGLLSSPLA